MNELIDIENKFSNKLELHSTRTPKGLKFYDQNILSAKQQKHVNKLKAIMIRENEKYLKKHPEVRAIVILLLTNILKEFSYFKDITAIIVKFFERPKNDIQALIDAYLEKMDTDVGEDETDGSVESLTSLSLKSYFYKSYSNASSAERLTIPIDLNKFDEMDVSKYLTQLSVGQGEASKTESFILSSETSSYEIESRKQAEMEMEMDMEMDMEMEGEIGEKVDFKYQETYGENEDDEMLKALEKLIRMQKSKEIDEASLYDYTKCIC